MCCNGLQMFDSDMWCDVTFVMMSCVTVCLG